MIKDKKFLNKIELKLKKKMGEGSSIRIQETINNNGVLQTSIRAGKKDAVFAPIICLEGYYEKYLAGRQVDEIVGELYGMFLSGEEMTESEQMDFADFSTVCDKVIFRLINRKANRITLEQVPYIEFHDLAIVFCIIIAHNETEQMTALIYRKHMRAWNISEFDLLRLAVVNTPLLLPVCLQSITDALKNSIAGNFCAEDKSVMVSDFPKQEKETMYVLTNERCSFGAAAVLYTDVLRQTADKLGEDLVVIPSSIHETILIVYDGTVDLTELKELVRFVNKAEVREEERLSDNIYLFRREKGYLEMAEA